MSMIPLMVIFRPLSPLIAGEAALSFVEGDAEGDESYCQLRYR